MPADSIFVSAALGTFSKLRTLNGWGVIRLLHAFSGVRLEDTRNGRDWFLTSLWAWAMDAMAVGLILMVLSSLYMWFDLRQKRMLGLISMSLGLVTCGLFCFGLRWLLSA